MRAGQEQVVRTLIDGRSALAVFPTGGGKSLCYQLPALLLDGLTLVISPLIALMKDQVDALVAKGIPAARLDSTQGQQEAFEVFDRLRDGSLKLLYVAPERLANEGFRNRLGKLRIALVAIDEAHCISEWGHNFRPDYLKLARLCQDLHIPRVLALTATATPAVAADIRAAFDIAKSDHVQLSFHRPNLDLRVTPAQTAERKPLLLERLRSTPGPAIVYVTRQETAEEVATFLQRNGLAAQAYHAGMPDEFRAAAQESFMTGTTSVIVATIAFGMGIDKADIRRVYHYNLPKSLENYSQEIGRAGRDGRLSICEWLACGDDLPVLENFIYGDTPTPQAIRHLIDRVLRLGTNFDVSQYDLSSSCDIRPLVVSTVLTYLELEGVIEATGSFYSGYAANLLRDFKRVLAGYDERRRDFLTRLFAAGTKGRVWTNFDIDSVAAKIGEPRERIVSALVHLEEAGDLALKKTGIRQGYRLLRDPGDLHALAERLNTRFQHREQSDLERLRQVVALAETPGCLTGALTAHFGETLEGPCGHCDRCRNIPVASIPRSAPRQPGDEEWSMIRDLGRERHAALGTTRQLARFLCGLTSPATIREKLTRHDAFGLLADLPFSEVLAIAEAQ
ncbi:RecQ family ATP-dependent DNA helicase [Luteolibacter ambystomatis]|uniref:ATP-dependent DNA helicase RecQ n=2 Tax=Luteolibacter ambystomatis TaxID=2824561 RepID=A0A975PH18_9BACT|nr:RecQ family ATP-dependent DNA helicase [Luteolibacter ambystomatis]